MCVNEQLTRKPVLDCPNFAKPFAFATEASLVRLGAEPTGDNGSALLATFARKAATDAHA